jgi:hypothetical protein
VPRAVAAVSLRKQLSLKPAVSLATASLAPLAVAAITPRSTWGYITMGATYMWTLSEVAGQVAPLIG